MNDAELQTTLLGQTGLRVTVMGLGCGGHSRLGISQGRSPEEAERVVREALDLGINFIDTAEGYRTEEIVGRAIRGVPRDSVVLSTKAGVHWEDRYCTGVEMKDRVNASLQRLGVGAVEVFHLHGVMLDDYDYALQELVPALLDLKQAGKIRHLGITEAFAPDPGHRTLARAVRDDCWEVMMVGFNILNQSARERVLKATREKGIGTLCMFAVRRALSHPDALAELLQVLVDQGLGHGIDPERGLDFLVERGIAESVPDAAYRFCRWEPGMDVVLFGTGNLRHLRENTASLNRPPLPKPVQERLRAMFAGIDSVSGN